MATVAPRDSKAIRERHGGSSTKPGGSFSEVIPQDSLSKRTAAVKWFFHSRVLVVIVTPTNDKGMRD